MKKIKILSLLIFLLSIILTIISIHVNDKNRLEIDIIDSINKQKAFTQEISKNIFYIYKNKNTNDQKLLESIKQFLEEKNGNKFNDKITKLWNSFYGSVQKFRNMNQVTTMYSGIILEKIVNDIYNTNLELMIEFDYLIIKNKNTYNNDINIIKNIQYTLFITFLFLLFYLFTQIKTIITFIQKFRNTSKNIITNSSIKELEQINIGNINEETLEASNNFNFLVQKVDISLNTATDLMKHSYNSLEHVEKNIEAILDLVYLMNDDKKIDKELTKKEDAVIQSLEELSSSTQSLKDLKINLSNLISHHKLK